MNLSNLLLCCSGPQSVLTSNAVKTDKFGELTRAVLVRRVTDLGAEVSITVADVVDKAALTALIAAVDDTKIVMTPIINEVSSSVSSATEYSSGNGNVPILISQTPSGEEFNFINTRQDTANTFNSYACTDIGIIFYDSCGNAQGIVDDMDTPTIVKPIPLSYFFVSTLERGTIDKPNKNMVKLVYKDLDWSKNVRTVAAGDFKPKSDFL